MLVLTGIMLGFVYYFYWACLNGSACKLLENNEQCKRFLMNRSYRECISR